MGNKSKATTVNVITVGVIILVILFFLWPRGGTDILPPEPTPAPQNNGVSSSFSYSPHSLTVYKNISSAQTSLSVINIDGNFTYDVFRLKIQDNNGIFGFAELNGFYAVGGNLLGVFDILNTFPMNSTNDELKGGYRTNSYENPFGLGFHFNSSEAIVPGAYVVYLVYQFGFYEGQGEQNFLVKYPASSHVWHSTATLVSSGEHIVIPIRFYEVSFSISVTVI
jgi:hypothetical protein